MHNLTRASRACGSQSKAAMPQMRSMPSLQRSPSGRPDYETTAAMRPTWRKWQQPFGAVGPQRYPVDHQQPARLRRQAEFLLELPDHRRVRRLVSLHRAAGNLEVRRVGRLDQQIVSC
jgi:hypothetical protein